MGRSVSIRTRSVSGPLRRAHPASGATWNVQVVREKMNTGCLWHACRALLAGLFLMLMGVAMATIGYYADRLSIAHELHGNTTISVKDEARGFHLNNLSYAGPIVMGIGGFIIVAACVMTFEARDSAAKVTPARPTATRGGAFVRSATRHVQRQPVTSRRDVMAPVKLIIPTTSTYLHAQHQQHTFHRFTNSAPDLRFEAVASNNPEVILQAKRNMFRYAHSVDYAPQTITKSESRDKSTTSLAMEVHSTQPPMTLKISDTTHYRRRLLERQMHIPDDLHETDHSAPTVQPDKILASTSHDKTLITENESSVIHNNVTEITNEVLENNRDISIIVEDTTEIRDGSPELVQDIPDICIEDQVA